MSAPLSGLRTALQGCSHLVLRGAGAGEGRALALPTRSREAAEAPTGPRGPHAQSEAWSPAPVLCARLADKAAVRVPLRHVHGQATASFAESCSPRSGSLGRHLSGGGGRAIRLAVTLHGPLPWPDSWGASLHPGPRVAAGFPPGDRQQHCDRQQVSKACCPLGTSPRVAPAAADSLGCPVCGVPHRSGELGPEES